MRGHRKRVLVTGGAGFLGSHLCDILVSKGYDVLCLDNFYTGVRDNISHLVSNPRFELIRHDVTFPLYVEVDEIYNFACPASPIHYQFDPVATTKTSVHGAINMLGLAKRTHARVLQASTSEVTAIQSFIRRLSHTGATSIPLDRVHAMMKVSAALRLYSSIIIGRTTCRSKSLEFSTPTGRACIQTTAEWCRILLFRR